MQRLTWLTASLVAGLALLSSTLSAAPVEKAIAPIGTHSGLIAGMVLPSGVRAWLGIPYARPPTGELRWQRPQPTTWRGVWNADRKMPECMQVLRPHTINHYFGEEPSSEDCLYLNIWAPAAATPAAKLPVIVFIYGGGFTIGSSGIPIYGGEQVARHNAVFVNFNYRVGVLGFLAHPELSREQGGYSGNYAFLDQLAALHWVHDNIARFGGDPARLIIIGQSAGAASVTQHVHSPLSKGLFRGAVMSSGCTWGAESGTSLAEAEKNGLEIQKRLGAANLAELRTIPADKIIAAQTEFQVGTSVTGGVRAGPIIDGYFMPKTLLEIARAHAMNDVPIIASFNHDESAIALMNATSVDDYAATARRLWGADADAFLALYPVRGADEIRRVGGQVAREQGLEANARHCAMIQHQYNQSSAYIDTFSRRHSYAPGVQIADQDLTTIGAYHTGDIPFFFGTLDAFNSLRTTRAWTASDRDLSETMLAALIAFARTGNPSTSLVHWPAWSPEHEVKLEFGGSGGQSAVVKLNTARLDWLKAHPPQSPAAAPGTAGRIGTAPRD